LRTRESKDGRIIGEVFKNEKKFGPAFIPEKSKEVLKGKNEVLE